MHHLHISNGNFAIEKPRHLDGGRSSVSVYANNVQINFYFIEVQNADQFFFDMIAHDEVAIAKDIDNAGVTLNFHRIKRCDLEMREGRLCMFSAYEADGTWHDFGVHFG